LSGYEVTKRHYRSSCPFTTRLCAVSPLLEVCIAVFSSPLVRAGLSVVNGTGEVRAVSADGHEVKPRRGRIADPAIGDVHSRTSAADETNSPRYKRGISDRPDVT
jgi:hypothetical protein